MKQYCRYCANAIMQDYDLFVCHIDQIQYGKDKAVRINKCKHFEFNKLDVFDMEKEYKPHEKSIPDTYQMKLGG